MSEQITKEQLEKEQLADAQMMATFAGLTDAEAFAQLFHDTVETLHMIHRQRGHVTDEDLLERSMWALENALGFKPATTITIDDL